MKHQYQSFAYPMKSAQPSDSEDPDLEFLQRKPKRLWTAYEIKSVLYRIRVVTFKTFVLKLVF